MLIHGTTISDKLISAAKKGELIVFAGAGISVDEPSGIPPFLELVRTITKEREFRPNENETPDRILGRLHKDKGISASLAIWSVLSRKASEPNTLHYAILELFGSTDRIKIVTTNFDGLLEAASLSRYGCSPVVYKAPVLPQGDDFNGIVHLHGLLEASSSRIVASDEEFGEAYMTKRWATTFLTSLFQSGNTILFIGYSHDDTVMEYLAQALSSGAISPRFAFDVGDAKAQAWKHRGIEHISYSTHADLPFILSDLAKISTQDILDEERRIRSIVEAEVLPEQDSLDHEYMKLVVQSNDLARFFRKYAPKRWFSWLKTSGFLTPLHSEVELSPAQQELAIWVALSFYSDPSPELDELVAQSNRRINKTFATHLSQQLAYGTPNPSGEVLRKWVPLLSSNDGSLGSPLVADLARRCSKNGLWTLVWLLLRDMIEPRFSLETIPDYGHQERDLRITPSFRLGGDHQQVRNLWEHHAKPGIRDREYASRVILDTELAIKAVYDFYSSWGRIPRRGWDLLTYSRITIEHSEDSLISQQPIDVLIDILRDALDGLLMADPRSGLSAIEAMRQSELPIMTRMASYGVWRAECLSPNEKLTWLIEHQQLLHQGNRHEVLQLLKSAYPTASNHLRRTLLDCIKRIGVGQADAEIKEEGERLRQQINLIGWLSAADPDCKLAAEELAQLCTENPGVSPDPHADLLIRTIPCSSYSPKTKAEISGMSPGEFLDFLSEFGERDPIDGPSTSDLLDEFKEAVSMNASWGSSIARAALAREGMSDDFWVSLIRGWEKATPNDAEWRSILRLLADGIGVKCSYDAASMLESTVFRAQGQIPLKCLKGANRVASSIWKAIENDNLIASEDHMLDAFGMLNTTQVRLVEFWIKMLGRLKTMKTDQPSSARVFSRLGRILKRSDWIGHCGRFAICKGSSRIYLLDHIWVERQILPLLIPGPDTAGALASWRGWLIQDRPIAEVLKLASMCYPKASKLILQQEDGFRKLFVQHMVWLCFHGDAEPTGEFGILSSLLTIDNEDVRTLLPSTIGWLLGREGSPADTWRRWLRQYCVDRSVCIPTKLQGKELGEMVLWLPDLEPVFDDAVDILTAITDPKPDLHYHSLIWAIEKDEISLMHPAALTKLLTWLADNGCFHQSDFFHMDRLVLKVSSAGLPQESLAVLCNSLSRAGFSHALHLYEESAKGRTKITEEEL